MGTEQGLVGVNDHGLHIIFKKTWTVKNFRFDEFTASNKESKTLEVNGFKNCEILNSIELGKKSYELFNCTLL